MARVLGSQKFHQCNEHVPRVPAIVGRLSNDVSQCLDHLVGELEKGVGRGPQQVQEHGPLWRCIREVGVNDCANNLIDQLSS